MNEIRAVKLTFHNLLPKCLSFMILIYEFSWSAVNFRSALVSCFDTYGQICGNIDL